MSSKYTAFEIVITAIIANKDDKYLITRRSMQKKRFGGKWTLPGGHLETSDYTSYPKDTEHYWYNVLEKALAREVKEEVGLEINNVKYVTSLATVHADDGIPSLVISCVGDYLSGEVILQEEEADKYEWVSVEEAKNYDLIDGIYDEIVMADNICRGLSSEGKEWQRA